MFYAVAKGRQPGVFNTWNDCNKSVRGFRGAKYKKFTTLGDANNFVNNKQQSPNKISTQCVKILNNKTTNEPTTEIDNSVDYYVYTDGSCINNGKKNAKAGMGIYFSKDNPRNYSARVVGKQSNNTGELGAIFKLYDII